MQPTWRKSEICSSVKRISDFLWWFQLICWLCSNKSVVFNAFMESIIMMISWSQNSIKMQSSYLLIVQCTLVSRKWILNRISTLPGGYPGTQVFFPGLIRTRLRVVQALRSTHCAVAQWICKGCEMCTRSSFYSMKLCVKLNFHSVYSVFWLCEGTVEH